MASPFSQPLRRPRPGPDLPRARRPERTMVLKLYTEFSMRAPMSTVPRLAAFAIRFTPSAGLQKGMV